MGWYITTSLPDTLALAGHARKYQSQRNLEALSDYVHSAPLLKSVSGMT